MALFDCDHNSLAHLHQTSPKKTVYLYAQEKDYLRIVLTNFYGDYQVHFDEVNDQNSVAAMIICIVRI
ncbi:hypothetical protein SAMN05421767_1132 [Granulicatella balaenopterae]|uniref:Uncharacterized protein n=1 Tax=Granulicatella balaenopterae TaxID=137733 RepID=A0A1H9KCK7_9LACT|nr:hypothetical protein [Granulicatella balaenopterae]SEQ96890.1 hypothetical protein SAMN05421767_1132 [Granulicatella balaenopterae]